MVLRTPTAMMADVRKGTTTGPGAIRPRDEIIVGWTRMDGIVGIMTSTIDRVLDPEPLRAMAVATSAGIDAAALVHIAASSPRPTCWRFLADMAFMFRTFNSSYSRKWSGTSWLG